MGFWRSWARHENCLRKVQSKPTTYQPYDEESFSFNIWNSSSLLLLFFSFKIKCKSNRLTKTSIQCLRNEINYKIDSPYVYWLIRIIEYILNTYAQMVHAYMSIIACHGLPSLGRWCWLSKINKVRHVCLLAGHQFKNWCGNRQNSRAAERTDSLMLMH